MRERAGNREHLSLAKSQLLVRMASSKVSVQLPAMTPEEAQRVQECIQEIASILYKNTDPAQLTNLEAIETRVRQQMLEHVSPNVALFLSNKSPKLTKANCDK